MAFVNENKKRKIRGFYKRLKAIGAGCVGIGVRKICTIGSVHGDSAMVIGITAGVSRL